MEVMKNGRWLEQGKEQETVHPIIWFVQTMDNLAAWNIGGANHPKEHDEISRLYRENKIGFLGVLENKLTERRGMQLFCVTVIYAANDHGIREELWNDLRAISDHMDLPWLLMGDFNTFLDPQEKYGGNPVDISNLADFRNCVDYCQLQDMNYYGQHLTSDNKQLDGNRVFCKLNKTLVNENWIQMWPNSQTKFLNGGISYHSPMIVRWLSDTENRRSGFKYFNMWYKAEEFNAVIQEAWQYELNGHQMFQFNMKMKKVKQGLKLLNKTNFNCIDMQELTLREKLNEI
ncbi:hypothetical protein RIF29_19767 [Crotalaria pallida]|uniref:Endonuclease/exonuclease/phosphatase domain-containing protein n=1 Tax=Crotalaria pallida TaxID=3830 RepID=A0AAN9F478_CROPI